MVAYNRWLLLNSSLSLKSYCLYFSPLINNFCSCSVVVVLSYFFISLRNCLEQNITLQRLFSYSSLASTGQWDLSLYHPNMSVTTGLSLTRWEPSYVQLWAARVGCNPTNENWLPALPLHGVLALSADFYWRLFEEDFIRNSKTWMIKLINMVNTAGQRASFQSESVHNCISINYQ